MWRAASNGTACGFKKDALSQTMAEIAMIGRFRFIDLV